MADKIAFLGTGIMGLPMARNLAKAGFAVSAWNRTRRKAEPLAEDGVTVCSTPAQAARDAGLVITMLTDTDAVLSAMGGPDGALGAMSDDAIWVQMSTVGDRGCRRLMAAAAERGVAFVDAPVLGTRQPAENGKLKIFAAGPQELRARLEPVFAPMGTVFRWFDDAGAASRMKLVANAWVLAMTDGVAASVALARAFGLDPQLFLDAIKGTASDSPYAHVKGAMMIKGEYEPSFALSAALKDANLVIEAGDEAGVRGELIAAVRTHLERAQRQGHGDEDMSALYYGHSPESGDGAEHPAPGR